MMEVASKPFSFDVEPPLGTAISRYGQRYVLVDRRPHIGRAGPTAVLTWQSRCAECEGDFQVTTGLSGIKAMNTRCPRHKAPGRPSTPGASEAVRRNRKWRKGGQS